MLVISIKFYLWAGSGYEAKINALKNLNFKSDETNTLPTHLLKDFVEKSCVPKICNLGINGLIMNFEILLAILIGCSKYQFGATQNRQIGSVFNRSSEICKNVSLTKWLVSGRGHLICH